MSGSSDTRPILIAGPTAVGKSEVAMLLAERLGGEIISVDSMQVYRGLDVGTAKPTATERERVPHRLIDVADVTEEFDAAKFASLAHNAVIEIQTRKRTPILCGGTGLYFRAFLEGLGEAPPAHQTLRAELESTALPSLLNELEQHDPETFAKIDKNNRRRVIRAVEVIRLTGKPFSSQRADWNAESRPPERFYCFTRNAADLHGRIANRVDRMFSSGLVEETRRLLEQGLAQNRTAMQAIGYRQVVEHLRGERSLAETIELVKVKTRQFAKRQMTWFRKQIGIKWIELAPEDKPDVIVERLKLD